MDPSWFYRNFLGDSCGPYSAAKMLAWYKDGHFSGDLMVKRTTSSTFFRLSSSQCFTQLVFDLEPKPAKIEDTDMKEEYVEKEIKIEDTDMNEEYVEKEIKEESSATLLNDTWQESPVPPVHKKAKMEIGEGFFKSRRGHRIKLRDRRSSGNGSAKLEVKEEYKDKEIKAESPHSFAKELEEYREYRNRIKQTNYWKFEKKSDNSRGFAQYYVMCTACPLALKDDSIEQMIEICEFPRHVRKVHGRKGLSWMNSAKGARGCKGCGASQVIVKNIKKHKKCIDRL